MARIALVQAVRVRMEYQRMSERTNYLTEDEVKAAGNLHQRAPYALCNVSMGFFSIARHYGGLTFQDCHYTYMDGHDECVRDDVLKLVTKMRRAKKPAPEPAPKHADIFAGSVTR